MSTRNLCSKGSSSAAQARRDGVTPHRYLESNKTKHNRFRALILDTKPLGYHSKMSGNIQARHSKHTCRAFRVDPPLSASTLWAPFLSTASPVRRVLHPCYKEYCIPSTKSAASPGGRDSALGSGGSQGHGSSQSWTGARRIKVAALFSVTPKNRDRHLLQSTAIQGFWRFALNSSQGLP